MTQAKGYPTNYGWMGKMPDGTWHLFATESEHQEAFREASEE